jgi:hypothetical protein
MFVNAKYYIFINNKNMNSFKQIIKPSYYSISEVAIYEIAPPFCNKCKKFLTDNYCKSKYFRNDCFLKHTFNNKSVFKKI